jgi:hypothetical protein
MWNRTFGEPQGHALVQARRGVVGPLLAESHRRERLEHLWVGRVPSRRLGQVPLTPLLRIVLIAAGAFDVSMGKGKGVFHKRT